MFSDMLILSKYENRILIVIGVHYSCLRYSIGFIHTPAAGKWTCSKKTDIKLSLSGIFHPNKLYMRCLSSVIICKA